MEEEDELFEVECFLNTRVKDGKRQYKVRWKGFPPDEDTWEPEENVLECKEVLEAFWRKKRRNANRRQKIRRYRLMSEEEDQDTASTSRDNKAMESFEPLGLTRQASKELAMCMNKSRKPKRVSESSSQAGSDVTLTGNDELAHTSSQSTLLSSQTGSDISTSDNELFGQRSDIKTSEIGNDFINHSTESANESNPANDVIDVSSQESLNQSDLERSPREISNKTNKSNSGKANKIEIISLLSDSEDTEGEGTGNQLSETQSPLVQQSPLDVSRDFGPVIRRDSFKAYESTPCRSSQNETPDSENVTDQALDSSSILSPGDVKDGDEDPFPTPARRKTRFELSLKKRRKRNLNTSDSSSSESPKTEEEVLDDGAKNQDNFSDENLVKTKGKTQLQMLKERMVEVENSEKYLGKKVVEFLDISEPKAKKAAIEERKSCESSMIDDVCPTITELKGIMHKIAKNKYQEQGDLGGTVEMNGIENQGSSDAPSVSTSDKVTTSKTTSCDVDITAEKMVSEESNAQEKEGGLDLYNPDTSERMLVEDDARCAFGGRVIPTENSEVVSNEGSEMNTTMSPSETEAKEDNLNDDIIHMTELPSLEESVDSKPASNEEENDSIGEIISDKDEEKTENIKERKLAVMPSSSKKALVLTSETTSRVLKNLRFLAAKTRESKNVETTMNLAASEKKNDDRNSSNIESGDNLGNANVDNEVNTGLVLEKKLIGSVKHLNENENEIEREIAGKTGVEEENKTRETYEEKRKDNQEFGLINVEIKPIDEESVRNYNKMNPRAEDVDKNCTEIDNTDHETEKIQNIGSLTGGKTKRFVPEAMEVVAPCTSELSTRCYDSLLGKEKNSEPITQDKTSDDKTLVKEDDIDSEVCTKISNTGQNSLPGAQSLSIQDTPSTLCCHGYVGGEETLTQNLQKHSAAESSPTKEKAKGKKSGKPKKMLKKNHEKTGPGKPVKRKKLLRSEKNNLNSKNFNFKQGVEEENSSSSSVKLSSRNSKALKRTKMKKIPKTDKKEDNNSTAKKSSPTLKNVQEEQGKKSLILDANFSSSLRSGDLIGAIIDEGDRENTLKSNQKKTSAAESNATIDLLASRQEEDMMIEDDEDFDFELEDFPLEKLLQEEDDIDLRYIPSPPAEPMEVPFASVKTAIRDGDEMTVRAALAGGLELDTLDGASGMTLLMLAAASGQDGVVELLLRRKADVNACQKNGMTALMHASEQGYPETAHVLLLCGADINKQQIAGETALMKACKKGHTDVVEVLLRNGADTKMESKSGHTAQQFAIRGYPELSSLMEENEKRLSRVVEEAILKCLGDAVSLCKPAILSHRCVVPREGQQMTFPFQYSPQLYNKEVDVILFCIKAVFDDVVSLLFGEDNGVRGLLLNNKPQIPLLHGIRSIFSIDPKSRQNTITLQTHKCNNPVSRIILCIYAVQGKS